MNMIVLGISHKNTPLEVREKFSLSAGQQDLLLSELKNSPAVVEAFVFSTCNRVEIYASLLEGAEDADSLLKVLFDLKKIPWSHDLARYFYRYSVREAVGHLFRVSTGLDSMVLGEKEILGQVKDAFDRARERGVLGRGFNILSNAAIRLGKKARAETAISAGGSSVSWAAVVKAQKELGTLADKTVLVMGAGKMSDAAIGYIQNKGVKKLYLMNRTQAHAEALAAKYDVEVVSFYDLKEVLAQADLCFCSVGAPHHILEKEMVQKVMSARQGRPLVFIDISMPRNIDPGIVHLEHVRLFQIDDLQEVVDSTMEERRKAAVQVEEMIRAKVEEFFEKIQKTSTPEAEADLGDPEFSTL